MTDVVRIGQSRSAGSSASPDWLRAAVVVTTVDTVGLLPIFLTGVLAIQLHEDIGLSVSLLGIVYASYFLAAALFSAPLATWADRTGLGRSLRVGLLIYLAAYLGIALTVHSVPVLIFYMLLCGVGTALTRSASSVLVFRQVAAERQGLAFGMKHSSIPLASLLAGLAVPFVALTVGWRWAYVVGAALTFAVVFTIPRDPVRSAQSPAPAVGSDLARRPLVLAAVAFGLGSAAASSLGTYSVTSAVSTGMHESAAGLLVAVGSVVGLASRVAVGHWSDHRQGNQLDLVIWMLVLGAGAFLLLGLSGPALLWIAAPLTFATGWAWLGSYNLAMVRLNPTATGTAIGITQTGAFLGGFAGPVGLGFVAEHGSFLAAWSVAAGLSFLAAVLVWQFRRRLEQGTQIG